VVTDEYDPIMAEVIRDQPPEMSALDALRAMLREMLPQLYADDLEVIRMRLQLTADVPALRARTFESMRGTFELLSEAIGERTGRAADDSDVEAFSWAVLGVMQAALYRLIDGKVGYEDLPDLLDRNLDFLSRGCPL
jgi:hypothetical protein